MQTLKPNSVDLTCPHCHHPLKAFEMPDGTGWDQTPQWACFNNNCSYYQQGWDWMWEKYKLKASYRYRVTNPDTKSSSPLPVWSETAIIDRLLEDEG